MLKITNKKLAMALLFFSLSNHANAQPPKQAVKNSCLLMSLSELTSSKVPEISDLNKSLEIFEQAFENHDLEKFKQIFHPALLIKAQQSKELFDNAIAAYGMDKSKLVRTSIFDLDFGANGEPIANCFPGDIRGVVGIKRQFVVIHSVITGHEQVRFFSIFSPVVPALLEKHKTSKPVALVMWQVQVWSSGGKSPETLLQESHKWSALKEPFVAWTLAEGAKRIFTSNPYFIPKELKDAESSVSQYFDAIPSKQQVSDELTKQKQNWEFLDFTVVFQDKGLEPGIRLRMRKNETIPDMLSKCKSHIKAIFPLLGDVQAKFSGIECLPFVKDEPLDTAPSIGTSFIKFTDIIGDTSQKN